MRNGDFTPLVEPRSNKTGAHALIVDDNQQNVAILAQVLAREGLSSTRVTRPEQLARTLPSLPRVDVAFVDLEMPELDGFAVFRLLRAEPSFEGVPIIACTVHLNEIAATYGHGFDGFIGKPLDARKFPDQLARILRGDPVWETA